MFVGICLLLVAITVDEIPSEDVLQIFDQKFYHVNLSSGEKTYLYRLFRPKTDEPGKKYPLVVWLHGYGDVEFERIGFGHLKHTGAIFQSANQAKQLAFYFLAVQCPIDQANFFRPGGSKEVSDNIRKEPPEPGEVVVKLIDDLIKSESIDARRVTFVGISGAGAACLEMGMRYPDRYAGMAILGSPGCDLSRLGRLKNVPVWAFHASEDPQIPVNGVENVVNSINSAGGTAHLTLIEGNYHNCWGLAFRDHSLLEWLLEQARGNPFAPRPGRQPSSTWQAMVFWAVTAGFVTLVTAEIQKRFKHPKAK